MLRTARCRGSSVELSGKVRMRRMSSCSSPERIDVCSASASSARTSSRIRFTCSDLCSSSWERRVANLSPIPLFARLARNLSSRPSSIASSSLRSVRRCSARDRVLRSSATWVMRASSFSVFTLRSRWSARTLEPVSSDTSIEGGGVAMAGSASTTMSGVPPTSWSPVRPGGRRVGLCLRASSLVAGAADVESASTEPAMALVRCATSMTRGWVSAPGSAASASGMADSPVCKRSKRSDDRFSSGVSRKRPRSDSMP